MKKSSKRKIVVIENKNQKHKISLLFSNFAKWVSEIVGNPVAFLIAVLLIVIWLVLGPVFHYSDTWQLIINTGTTIITFLIVFLIQHTQNRDTEILNLKIDELIRGHKGADNSRIDLSALSDEELKEMEQVYTKLCKKRPKKRGRPESTRRTEPSREV